MRRIAVMAMVVLSGLLLAGSLKPTAASAQAPDKPEQASQASTEAKQKKTNHKVKDVVKVKSGDSLSKIARRKDTTYKRIYYFNKQVKDPNVIFPGQKLKIPKDGVKLKPRIIATAPKQASRAKPAQQQSNTNNYVAPAPTINRQPQRSTSRVSGGVWDRLAACESGGNWQINTGNGYYGGLQFSLSSWRGVGGKGYPHQASKAEQIRRAEMLKSSGGWGHWPACSAKLGLRQY